MIYLVKNRITCASISQKLIKFDMLAFIMIPKKEKEKRSNG